MNGDRVKNFGLFFYDVVLLAGVAIIIYAAKQHKLHLNDE